MTESPQSPADKQEVSSLAVSVTSLSHNVLRLADRIRSTRRLSITTAVGLVADLILTIVTLFVIHAVLHQGGRQDCINAENDARNRTTVAFFVAERAKLEGQARGLEDLARHRPRGFAEFQSATASDLVFINSRLHALGLKFGPHGNPVLDPHGDPVIVNPPKGC